MSNTLQVTIVSTEASIYEGLAKAVYAEAALGEVGILPGHTALLSSMPPGQVRILGLDDTETVVYVEGGVLEVQPHSVTVLAETAMRAQDLDEVAAEAARKAAQTALLEKSAEFEYSKAAVELARAIAQLRAIKSLRQKMRH